MQSASNITNLNKYDDVVDKVTIIRVTLFQKEQILVLVQMSFKISPLELRILLLGIWPVEGLMVFRMGTEM